MAWLLALVNSSYFNLANHSIRFCGGLPYNEGMCVSRVVPLVAGLSCVSIGWGWGQVSSEPRDFPIQLVSPANALTPNDQGELQGLFFLAPPQVTSLTFLVLAVIPFWNDQQQSWSVNGGVLGIQALRQSDASRESGNWHGRFSQGTLVLPSHDPTNCTSVLSYSSLNAPAKACGGLGAWVEPISLSNDLRFQIRGFNFASKTWTSWLTVSTPTWASSRNPQFIGLRTVEPSPLESRPLLFGVQFRVLDSNSIKNVPFGMTFPYVRQ